MDLVALCAQLSGHVVSLPARRGQSAQMVLPLVRISPQPLTEERVVEVDADISGEGWGRYEANVYRTVTVRQRRIVPWKLGSTALWVSEWITPDDLADGLAASARREGAPADSRSREAEQRRHFSAELHRLTGASGVGGRAHHPWVDIQEKK